MKCPCLCTQFLWGKILVRVKKTNTFLQKLYEIVTEVTNHNLDTVFHTQLECVWKQKQMTIAPQEIFVCQWRNPSRLYMIVKSTIFCWYYILSPFSFQEVIFLNLVIQLKVSAHVIFLFVRTVLFNLTCYILKIHSPEHIKNITSAFPTPDTDFSFDIAVLILYPSFR